MLPYGKSPALIEEHPFLQLLFQHHHMELPVKDLIIQIIGEKPVPPAEMIADQKHGKPFVLNITFYNYSPEMPPEHQAGVITEKPNV